MHIRTYDLPDCWVHQHEEMVHTVFKVDHANSVFCPPKTEGAVEPSFLAAMGEMGYADPMRYAVEHELAHHVVAQATGREHSYVVWRDAHGESLSMDDPEVAAEEHLANRLQRYCNLGFEDPYGQLQHFFGDRLPRAALDFMRFARPWLLS